MQQTPTRGHRQLRKDSLVGWVERILPKLWKGTQNSDRTREDMLNRKPRETQHLCDLRAPAGLKLGFTTFWAV